MRTIWKKNLHKKGLAECLSQGVGPEFKPQYPIKKKILNLALGGCNMLFIINGKSLKQMPLFSFYRQGN
jgi:hypothetical protein